MGSCRGEPTHGGSGIKNFTQRGQKSSEPTMWKVSPSSAVVISLHHFAVEMYSGDTTRPRKERSRPESYRKGSTFWPGLVGSDGDPDDAVAADLQLIFASGSA